MSFTPHVLRAPAQLVAAIALSIALLATGCGDETGSSSTTSAGQVTLTPNSSLIEFVPPDPTDVAVTIDGQTFTYAQVTENNPEYVFGGPQATFELDFFVRKQVVDVLLVDKGLTESTGADDELRQQLLTAGVEGADAAETDQLINEIRLAYNLAGLEPMTDQAARALYEADDSQYRLTCSSHILHETEAEAQATLQLLADGEAFADVAKERSTGPSGPSGGELGCNPPGTMVPEFSAAEDGAEVGEYIGPVETQFGFHVLVVTERQATPFEQAAAGIKQEQLLADLQPATDAFFAEMANHTVEIDPRAGVWAPEQFQVLPPGSPTVDPFTTVPATVPAAGE